MKRILIIAISILAGTAVMLGAVAVLLFAAIQIDTIQTMALRVGARIATLLLGMTLLVAATYFSTHLVVRLFRHDEPPPESSN
jgi:hypothetical protein